MWLGTIWIKQFIKKLNTTKNHLKPYLKQCRQLNLKVKNFAGISCWFKLMQGSSKWKVYMQLKQQTNNDFNILYFEFETIVTSSKDITRWNSKGRTNW